MSNGIELEWSRVDITVVFTVLWFFAVNNNHLPLCMSLNRLLHITRKSGRFQLVGDSPFCADEISANRIACRRILVTSWPQSFKEKTSSGQMQFIVTGSLQQELGGKGQIYWTLNTLIETIQTSIKIDYCIQFTSQIPGMALRFFGITHTYVLLRERVKNLALMVCTKPQLTRHSHSSRFTWIWTHTKGFFPLSLSFLTSTFFIKRKFQAPRLYCLGI